MTSTKPRALVVFDLDGTLLRGPTVCEVLAQSLDRLPRMQEFEGLKSREDISAARKEMALWYREVSRDTLLESLRHAQFAPGLDAGISLLQAHGVVIGIASITWHFAVAHFSDRWGIDHRLATVLDDSGEITHVWSEHKAQWLLDLAAQLNISAERTAAIGDSSGDYDMLNIAGIPVFVGMEHPLQPTYRHMPGADIEEVARCLIDTWSL